RGNVIKAIQGHILTEAVYEGLFKRHSSALGNWRGLMTSAYSVGFRKRSKLSTRDPSREGRILFKHFRNPLCVFPRSLFRLMRNRPCGCPTPNHLLGCSIDKIYDSCGFQVGIHVRGCPTWTTPAPSPGWTPSPTPAWTPCTVVVGIQDLLLHG